MRWTRRDFGRLGTMSGAGFVLGIGAAAQGSTATTRPNVALIDRARILAAADTALANTIPSLPRPPQPATIHDYYTPEGGEGEARQALFALTTALPALAAGYSLLRTQEEARAARYKAHAEALLRAWFVDATTKMNPTMAFASFPAKQVAQVVTIGNPEGIFEAAGLAEVAVAIPFLHLDDALLAPVVAWFAAYLVWLTTSRLAGLARDRKDHHASSWLLQVAAFARLAENNATLEAARHRYKSVTIRAQINGAGIFPNELASPAAFRDSLTNLDLLAGVCELLSTRFESVWNYELVDGPGMRSASACFYPYIAHPGTWPYPADLNDFSDLPGRRPAMLLAGRAYARPEYAALWTQMEQSTAPDSASPAIQRSFPITQPLLWVTQPGVVRS